MRFDLLVFLAVSMLLAVSASATVFRVDGRGEVVIQFGGAAVVGETVRLSFSYEPADFRLAAFGDNFVRWEPRSFVPLTAIGSESGPISVDPIFSAWILNNLSTSGHDVWQFDTGPNPGTSTFAARNLAGTAFDSPLPKSFEIAHTRFLEQFSENLWKAENVTGLGTAPGAITFMALPGFVWVPDGG